MDKNNKINNKMMNKNKKNAINTNSKMLNRFYIFNHFDISKMTYISLMGGLVFNKQKFYCT